MLVLPLIGYLGLFLGFAFLTLAIASGLYYLSELVEEHTEPARRLLTRVIYAVIALQAGLALVDGLPWWPSAISVASHVIYARNLRRFPWVKLTDPVFVLSCALVITNHFLWFRYFSGPRHSRSGSPHHAYPAASSHADLPTFTEVASFFGLCVWLVPFALFVSLSAGENVLPSMGSEYATGRGSSYISSGAAPGQGGRGDRRRRNAGMAKALVNGFRSWFDEAGALVGLWRAENVRP